MAKVASILWVWLVCFWIPYQHRFYSIAPSLSSVDVLSSRFEAGPTITGTVTSLPNEWVTVVWEASRGISCAGDVWIPTQPPSWTACRRGHGISCSLSVNKHWTVFRNKRRAQCLITLIVRVTLMSEDDHRPQTDRDPEYEEMMTWRMDDSQHRQSLK